MDISRAQFSKLEPFTPLSTPSTSLYAEPKTDLSPSVIPDGVVLSGNAQDVLDRAKAYYLPNPVTFWDAGSPEATCQPSIPKDLRANRDNFAQRGIKGLGNRLGRGFRVLGDGLGKEVGDTIRNPMRLNPIVGPAIRSAEILGLPSPVPKVTLPGQNILADTAESAVRGVGEFGASTSEDLTYAVAHPDRTAKGLYTLANTALANDPLMGPSLITLESLATGKSVQQVWGEKQQTMADIRQGVVDDFNETKDRVGLPGAVVKAGLDIFGLPKAGAKGAVTAARITDDALGVVPGGPMVRRSLDSVHPDPKRRATARAERENFRTEEATKSGEGWSTGEDLAKIKENYAKEGLGEALDIEGTKVTVRGLRTARERKALTNDLQQVQKAAGADALKSFGELMLTDHPGVATFNSKVKRVAGFFSSSLDKAESLVVIKRSALGEGTVAHELGHAVDATDPKMSVWVSESFDSPFGLGERKSRVSDYAKTNAHEDWAETFREFVTNPRKLDDLGKTDDLLGRKVDFMKEYVEQRKTSVE